MLGDDFFFLLLFNFHLSHIPSPSFPLFLCMLLVTSCLTAKHFCLSNANPLFFFDQTLAQSFVCVECLNEEEGFVFRVLEQQAGCPVRP